MWYGSSTGLGANGTPTNCDWMGGSNQGGACFGSSVSSGDFNGDGYDDLIVGARWYDNGNYREGAVFVWYGSSTGLGANGDPTNCDWMGESNQGDAYFGNSVSSGDFNGDGYDDLIVGAFYYDNGERNEGAVFIWYGSSTGLGANGDPTNYDWMGESNQASVYFGGSVSLGDFNSDGYDDLIVGACYYDSDGAAFVWYGSSTGLIDTVGIPTNCDWMGANGIFARFGNSVSSGDFNGDGYDDLIVSAYWYDNGEDREGAVFVWHGSSAGLPDTLGTPADCDWMGESNQTESDFPEFGYSVASGDFNGDGYLDVAVGACWYDNGEIDEGAVFLWYGSSTGLGANGDPTNCDWMAESNQYNAYFGWSVSSGDFNGDGYDDLIVGEPYYSGGAVFVWHGSSAGLGANGTPLNCDWMGESNQVGAYFGWSVSSGDFNGDGYDDLIVGARYYNNGQNDEGAVFVWHGGSTGLGANGDPTNCDWMGESNQSPANFGISVSSGDFNGDGYDDLIVGAYDYDNSEANEGVVFLWYGSDTGLGPNGNPSNCDWMGESNQNWAEFGSSIAVGDLNGDGYDDLIVGAEEYNNGEAYEGAVFVWYGSSTGLGANGTPTNCDWMAESNPYDACFGSSVSSGDLNGDGYDDLIVGAPLYDNGRSDEGAVFVWHGTSAGLGANGDPTNCDWMGESNQAYAYFGRSVSSGDFNGDGYDDLIVGADDYDNGEGNEGAVFVWYFAPDIELSDTTHDYGDVWVGDTVGWQLWIYNQGNTDLVVDSITLTTTVYSITDITLPATIPAGNSQSLTVKFAPPDTGKFYDTAKVHSNDSDELMLEVYLSGRGVIPDIELSDTTHDYGDVWVGDTVDWQLWIYNKGNTDLVVDSITLATIAYSIIDISLPDTISPGDSQSLGVEFIPQATGVVYDSLRIYSNDPDEVILEVYLSGRGVASNIVVPGSHNYGNVAVGDTLVWNMYVKNVGNTILTVDSIIPSDEARFIVDYGLPCSIMPADSELIPIKFASDGKPANESLFVYSNAPDELLSIVKLYANADIELSDTLHDYEDVWVGDTLSWWFKIYNLGSSMLTVDSIIVTNPNFWHTTGTSQTIEPGDSLLVNTEFSPQDTGVHLCTLKIISDDPDESVRLVYLEGRGIMPGIELSDTTHDYGVVEVNDTSSWELWIYNKGNVDLVVDSITLTTPVYTITGLTLPDTIIASDSQSIIIKFTPQDTGKFYDTLNVYSNDPYEPVAKVFLSGRGVIPDIVLQDTLIILDTVAIGDTVDFSFYIKNEGSAILILDSIKVTNSALKVEPTSSPINPNDSLKINGKYMPQSPEQDTGRILIYSNDPNEPVVYVKINSYIGIEELPLPKRFEFKIISNPLQKYGIIYYALPVRSYVSIKIYDVMGRCVTNVVEKEVTPGFYLVEFKTNLSQGIYFVKMSAGKFKSVRKFVVIK